MSGEMVSEEGNLKKKIKQRPGPDKLNISKGVTTIVLSKCECHVKLNDEKGDKGHRPRSLN